MEMQADYWRKQSTLAAQAEKVRILSGQVAAKPIKRSPPTDVITPHNGIPPP
jgi:hypothetical protein